jgi:hypothetical protein
VSRFLGYFTIWLAAALFFSLFMGRNAFNYYRIKNKGVLTDGTAIAWASHGQIKYSFRAENRVYTGIGTTGFDTPPSEKISIGERLPVYYLSGAPEINCLGSPSRLLDNELVPALLATLLFPSAIVGRIAFRRRKLKRV